MRLVTLAWSTSNTRLLPRVPVVVLGVEHPPADVLPGHEHRGRGCDVVVGRRDLDAVAGEGVQQRDGSEPDRQPPARRTVQHLAARRQGEGLVLVGSGALRGGRSSSPAWISPPWTPRQTTELSRILGTSSCDSNARREEGEGICGQLLLYPFIIRIN